MRVDAFMVSALTLRTVGRLFAICIAAVLGVLAFLAIEDAKREKEAKDKIAAAAGFLDSLDWERAKKAGFVTPDTWRVEKNRREIAERIRIHIEETDRKRKAYESDLQISACIKAERAVKEILKAPSTAKFERCDDVRISRDRTKVFVRGNVDAQNSFGAMLRNRYLVSFDHQDGVGDGLKALSNPMALLDPPF